MKILLVTAPMIQINTPYPATAYLKGFLSAHPEHQVEQRDPAIALALKIFSLEGLVALKKDSQKKKNPELKFFLDAYEDYKRELPGALALLQGKHHPRLKKLAARDLLPEGPSFEPLHEQAPILEQWEGLPLEERAQYLASLFLDDIALYYKLAMDADFAFSRYGEKLAASNPSFNALEKRLSQPPTFIDSCLDAIAEDYLEETKPSLFGISAPFAGTVYAALRMGRVAKKKGISVVMGGGYPNTELRSLKDPRIFSFVDFITLDDGERPLLCLLEFLEGKRKKENLKRTYALENGQVVFYSDALEKDIPFPETGTPDYTGLPLGDYISLTETLNPVTRLWSGAFWNKLTLAHGCYWHRCSFCDTSLDYIGRYETEKATKLADKMEAMADQTKCKGFHFVDEAAPPAILKSLSEELIKRKSDFEWWGNIRFDKAFTPELAKKMADAGCIAVTGGLEVASPRILSLIEKGITLEQVVKVTKAFQEANIFVHAYLMYGFPSQTEQETIDSLEVVRQLFLHGCLQSAFWHRFAATIHSPVGRNPDKYGITLLPQAAPPEGLFSQNDIPFLDPVKTPHDDLGLGLKKALYNYMHGIGLEEDVRFWFDRKVPKAQIPAKLVADFL